MKKSLSFVLAVLISTLFFLPINAEENYKIESSVGISEGSYDAYIDKYADAEYAGKETVIKAADYSAVSGGSGITAENYKGENALVFKSEGGIAEYSFSVNESALYAVRFRYCSIEHKRLDITLNMKIDKKLPFKEAEQLVLRKQYRPTGSITKNAAGDDISPQLAEYCEWTYSRAVCGYYDGELLFYLESGAHTLEIGVTQEYAAISEIAFVPPERVSGYNEYAAAHKDKKVSGYSEKFEAENIFAQSVTLNLLKTDKSSTKTSPFSYNSSRLNILGGENWKSTGQWVEWKIEAPEEGFYNVDIRYSQSYAPGRPSLRRLYVNGETPFKEALCIKFDYCSGWGMTGITDKDGKELPIWLKKGENTLRLEVAEGENADIIRRTENIVYELNQVYRSIIKITGSSPDTYRDYELEKQIPSLIPTFERSVSELNDIYGYFSSLSENANSANVIQVLSRQLKSFISSPASIAGRASAFSSNIGSLSSWATELKAQSLDIDYITVSSPDSAKASVNDNFFEALLRECRMFLQSFVSRYGSNDRKAKDGIVVWLNSGRDQASVISRLTEEVFEPESGISVQLKFVSANLIQAFLSGNSPDAMVLVDRGIPVDLALRGALLDLKQFSDFESAVTDYQATALEPYMFENGCYGLPDSQSFYMMFYRKDILQELKIEPPQTWNEFIAAVEIIQRHNMTVGVPYAGVDASGAASSGIGTKNIFSALLLQSGGSFFNESFSKTAFSSETAKATFKQWTELYSEYGLDISYNFFNRFRTGEMPLAIEMYTSYNQLSIAAPEIAGAWEMTAIPGTERDGAIDRSEGAAGTACVISKTSRNKEKAWEFVKFWVGEKAQSDYAADIEAQLGVGGRFAPANMKALERMAWTAAECEAIKAQWQQIKEIRNVPGGYYVTRGLDNAFRNVVYNKTDPYRALASWDKEINNEIARKREEFHLDEE